MKCSIFVAWNYWHICWNKVNKVLVCSCYFICEYCTMFQLKIYEGVLCFTGDCFTTNWNYRKYLFIVVTTYFPRSILQTKFFLVILRPLFSRMYSVISEAEVSLLSFCKVEAFFHYVSHECLYQISWRVFHFLPIV